jgi:hypothetical protein
VLERLAGRKQPQSDHERSEAMSLVVMKMTVSPDIVGDAAQARALQPGCASNPFPGSISFGERVAGICRADEVEAAVLPLG